MLEGGGVAVQNVRETQPASKIVTRDSGGACDTQRMLETVASLHIKPSQRASCTTLVSAGSEQL